MYTVNFESAAFILTLVCLIYSLTVKRRQYRVSGSFFSKLQNQHFVFLLLLLSNLFSAASSVGGVWLTEVTFPDVGFWRYLLHALYFFFHSTLSICFTLYIMNVNGTSIGRGRLFYSLFVLPYILAELLVLTNSYTGLAFYMDDAMVYHRGPMIAVLYGVGALYIVLGFYFFFRYNQAVSRADSIAIGTVIVMASLGIVIQAVRPDLLVELFAESLAFLMLMILLEERSGHIDLVTGTLNRVAFADANRRLMQTNQHYSVILVRITNMDMYSKLFSGREMEKLLMQLASWLTELGGGQNVFSCGQEEFAVLVMDSGPAAAALAQKILDRFEQDWKSGNITLRLEAAVAVVRVPNEAAHLDQLEDLLASSYHTSKTGSHLVSYDELSAFQRSRNMELALRSAIENGKLRVWYQPIWSVEQQDTSAAEALLRIDDEEFRGVSPEVYIPIAEKSGLIREIGMFVFAEVCRFLRDHAKDADALEYIELNLSVYQFMYDNLAESFEEIRSGFDVSASRLNIEITESASEQATAGMAEAMEELRTLGYTFSLDDFGTGYSNLSRLVKGGYLNIKIDRSLLWDADRNPDARRLLNSLIQIIRKLGYNVVQEGVETPAQLERVSEAGCNLIQGYYFSRPLPEADFLRYLRAERERPEKSTENNN